MELLLKLDGRTSAGGSPLLMHSERLADPLEEIVREIAKVSKKRNKTDTDHQTIARLEFIGGMYTNGNGPCLPAWNILRCLQEAAQRTKRGKDVLRGVYPLAEHVDVFFADPETGKPYDGDRATEALWSHGGFALRKSVGVQRARTMRTRPVFSDWSAELPIEVDATIFDQDVLAEIWRQAGVYVGMADMRPVYGRFAGTVEARS
jgi:hypothetical protein